MSAPATRTRAPPLVMSAVIPPPYMGTTASCRTAIPATLSSVLHLYPRERQAANPRRRARILSWKAPASG
jgi:hypothetical protein